MLRGVEFPTTLGGGKHTAYGSAYALLSATTFECEDTEMSVLWDAPFMRPADIVVTGADLLLSPEGLLALFTRVQKRGRLCNVTAGPFARVGVLRTVTPSGNRGYTVDPKDGNQGNPGVNIACKLKWQWSGEGIAAPAPAQPPSGAEIATGLSLGAGGLASALSEDAFAPDLGAALSGALGNIRKGVSDLRKAVKQVGDLAKMPASLANQALSTARSLGNVVNDMHNTLSDVADEYAAARGGLSGLLAFRRAKGNAKRSLDALLEQVSNVFDALARRKPTVIGVRPGQSLVDIAKAALGAGDRWPEIAARNEIAGQVVPVGMFVLEIPPRGG
jgi:hypothetical protein